MPIESVMPSSHLILCHPLLLLPPNPPSIRVFSSESTLCMKWPKYWSFSFQHQSLQWTSRTYLLQDGLVGSPCSPRDSRVFSNTTIQKHQFFGAQLSSQYNSHIHTWPLEKPQTFVGKIMSLLFNILSRLVIIFLSRSKHLLISWLQSPSAVILEPKKIKSDTVSTVSPSISHEVMGTDAMILVFWMLSFKPMFSLSSFTFIKRRFISSSLSAIRTNIKKRYPFHYRGLECKSRKSKNTWSNRQGWPWSTEWSMGGQTEFCQEDTLVTENTLFQQHNRRLYSWTPLDGQHRNQTDFSLQPKREKLYIVSKNKTRSWWCLRSWTYCQIQT